MVESFQSCAAAWCKQLEVPIRLLSARERPLQNMRHCPDLRDKVRGPRPEFAPPVRVLKEHAGGGATYRRAVLLDGWPYATKSPSPRGLSGLARLIANVVYCRVLTDPSRPRRRRLAARGGGWLQSIAQRRGTPR